MRSASNAVGSRKSRNGEKPMELGKTQDCQERGLTEGVALLARCLNCGNGSQLLVSQNKGLLICVYITPKLSEKSDTNLIFAGYVLVSRREQQPL
jgi:hypothetical protein